MPIVRPIRQFGSHSGRYVKGHAVNRKLKVCLIIKNAALYASVGIDRDNSLISVMGAHLNCEGRINNMIGKNPARKSKVVTDSTPMRFQERLKPLIMASTIIIVTIGNRAP
jgi:hypothetical protein